jgi:hypothetical protein
MNGLVLAAHMAASRFASARRRLASPAHPREAWLPVALRWRRSRKRQANERTAAAKAPGTATATWLANVHLHFAITRAADRTRHEVVHWLARDERRTLLTRRSATLQTATLMMHARRAPRAPRSLPEGGATKMRAPRIAAVFARPRPVPAPSIARIVDRTQRLLVDTMQRQLRVRSSATYEHAFHATERQTRMHSRELRTFRLIRSAAAAARPSPASPPPPPALAPPPELVWRSAPRPAGDVAGETPRGASSRPVKTQEAAPETPPRAARAALRINDLDPALLDRLTDDVIRRVERRVRIERERRGL